MMRLPTLCSLGAEPFGKPRRGTGMRVSVLAGPRRFGRSSTRRWLDPQRSRLLPCPYFLVPFTLPAELRALVRSHQKRVDGRPMIAAAALLKLTADPQPLGARPGLLA